MSNFGSSHVRSLLVFTDDALPKYFVKRILTKYKLLKALHFNDASLDYVPKYLWNLMHLKYLSFSNTEVQSLPKSIGKLHNLETLDLRQTVVDEIPEEVGKLKKLRHLLGNKMSLIQLKDGIGGMTSLQTLHTIGLDGDGVVELIRELGKLKQLRKLGLLGVRRKHGSALSSSINEMQHLEKLHIYIRSKFTEEVIDLNLISSPPKLRSITLRGKLEKLPEWIPELQNLVHLTMEFSQLINDPMKSLENMQKLLSLSIIYNAYEGESLHFQDGGFQKLKELYFGNSDNLNYVVIDEGALQSLEKLELWDIPGLKAVPIGIYHLEKLQVLRIYNMPTEFVQSIAPDGGEEHWIIEHVPLVEIRSIDDKSS